MLLVAIECYEGDDAPRALYSYATKFSARTGKVWADGGQRANANACWERALKLFRESGGGGVSGRLVMVPLLQLCVWSIEYNLRTEVERAEEVARVALSLTSSSGESGGGGDLEQGEELGMLLGDLAVVLYNLGVRAMKGSSSKEAVVGWFEGALMMSGRGSYVKLDTRFRADVLRALARCSLDATNPKDGREFEKAMGYLEQAQEMDTEPTNRLLLIEVYWMANRSEGDVMFEQMLMRKEVEVSRCRSLMSVASRRGRCEVVDEVLERVMRECEWRDEELEELRLMQLELLVNAYQQQICCDSAAVEEEDSRGTTAAELSDRVNVVVMRIIGERVDGVLSAKNEPKLYLLLWQLATEAYKAKKWLEAIVWFRRVLEVGLAWAEAEEGAKLRAKCFCLLAKSHLSLDEWDEALEYGEAALEATSSFFPALVILFEVYLKQDRVEKVHEIIERVMKVDETQWKQGEEMLSPVYLMELLISQALDCRRSEVTLRVLEALLMTIGSRREMLQSLTLSYGFMLRTALKMMWSEMADGEDRSSEAHSGALAEKGDELTCTIDRIHRAGCLMRRASQVLKEAGRVVFSGAVATGDTLKGELTWLSHCAFNLAVKAQKHKLFENAHDLFIESAYFCKSAEDESRASLKQQRKCRVLAVSSVLLMHAGGQHGASLPPSGDSGNGGEVVVLSAAEKAKRSLEGALQHVSLCHRLTERLSRLEASPVTHDDAEETADVEFLESHPFEDEKSMDVMLFLLDFQLRVLLRHPSQELFAILDRREGVGDASMMIQAFEALSWFIWEQCPTRCSLRLVGLELCYRLDALYRKKWSLSRHNDNDSSSPSELNRDFLAWLSNLRRAVLLCPDKTECLQVYQKAFDVLRLKGTVDDDDEASADVQRQLQWLMIEAYNNGVYYSRLGKYDVSERWLTTALFLLPYYMQKSEFEATFRGAYEQVLKKL